MRTFLITWNPKRWHWEKLLEMAERVFRGEHVVDEWTVASSKIQPGDQLFLLRQGDEPRGIMASAVARSSLKIGPHYDEARAKAGETRTYVDLVWLTLVIPEEGRLLSRERLDQPDLSGMYWNTQKSGIEMPQEVASRLERLWTDHVASLGLRQWVDPLRLPEPESNQSSHG